jgi:chromosome segregation protein
VAPLIDLALGDAAQRFVVRDARALDSVLASLGELPGRVGFIPLSASPSMAIDGLGASSLVHCDHPGLAHLLLGHVLIVEDRAAARPGFRCVTRAGVLLEPDGTVTVGPPLAEAGILSRKSELRHLRQQIADLDARIAAVEAEQSDLRRRADALDAPIRDREAEIAALTGEAGSLRDQILEQRQVQRQLADTLELLSREAAIAEAELAKADAAWRGASEQAEEADREAEMVKARLADADAALVAAERDRDERVRENTDAQVALSRVNERLAGLRTKRDELDAELRQRRIDAVNLASADRSVRGRLLESQLAALRAGSAAAAAYADKESRERHAAELTARRDALRAGRERLQHDLKHSRDAWKDRHDQAHAHELAARDLTNRRDALAQRIGEEYGVSLAELAGVGDRVSGIAGQDDVIPLTPADERPSSAA